MKEHPTIFTGELIRAILDGKKTQTRRVIRPQPEHGDFLDERLIHTAASPSGYAWDSDEHGTTLLRCPYGVPGDRLWVRETMFTNRTEDVLWYKAGGMPEWCGASSGAERKWIWKQQISTIIPSIHMPRWASRILLEVKEIRVERVQDITEADAIAEGVAYHDFDGRGYSADGCFKRDVFRDLWDSINKKRGYGWDVNPWVWAVKFVRAA